MKGSSIVRLVSFASKNNVNVRVGAMLGETGKVVDLSRFENLHDSKERGFLDMQTLIGRGLDCVGEIKSVLKGANGALDERNCVERGDYKIFAPIPTPRRNVMCVGKNYKDHVAEIKKVEDKKPASANSATPSLQYALPVFFTKAPDCGRCLPACLTTYLPTYLPNYTN